MPFYYVIDIFNKKEKHDSLGLVGMMRGTYIFMFIYIYIYIYIYYVDLIALLAHFRINISPSILLE